MKARLLILLLALTGLAACRMEDCAEETSRGWVRIGALDIDMETSDGIVLTRAVYEDVRPEAADLSYTIIDEGGARRSCSYSELSAGIVLGAGEYTLRAEYGADEMSASLPYLCGEQAFAVVGLNTASVNLTVSLRSAIIRPDLAVSLTEHYTSYSLSVTDGIFSIPVENGQDAFVPAGGSYSLVCTAVNAAGASTSFSQEVSGAAARTRYVLSCSPDLPVFALPSQSAADAWARRIYITPLSESDITDAKGASRQAMLDAMVYEVSSDGSSWTQAAVQPDGRLCVTGLNPSTSYQIRARLGKVLSSNVASLTTEAADGVPNGDFEELTQTINSTINQGGRWTQTNTSRATRYQTTLSMVISEPNQWATVNSMTCNLGASNVNSWYCIPSTYNTSLTWNSNQPQAKVGFTGQSAHVTTADIYTSIPAQHGSNAMVIRNVAWDSNGPSISDDQKTGNTSYSNYYCSKEPSSIANRSAGELFLGTFSGNAENQGASFCSRPSALNGYFLYLNDSQDPSEEGTISVTLLNGATTVASGSGTFSARNEYASFSVVLNYATYSVKATELRIMIKSSNRTSGIKTTNYCNKEECCSRGATLAIDNLTFTYE